MQHCPHRGFSLLEMTMVLAIIGLIVGSIIVGRDLIEAAELQTIMNEVNSYKAAVNTFQIKYGCLPGDCAFATNFFGTDPSPGACGIYGFEMTPPMSGTCNGNGSGLIGEDENNEPFAAWQQLAYAGLIGGNYAGTCYPIFDGVCDAGRAMKAGLDAPLSKARHGTYAMLGMTAEFGTSWFGNTIAPGATFWSTVNYGNVLWYGGDPSSMVNNNFFNGFFPLLSPLEASSIDTKMDDGDPAHGHVVSFMT